MLLNAGASTFEACYTFLLAFKSFLTLSLTFPHTKGKSFEFEKGKRGNYQTLFSIRMCPFVALRNIIKI